MGGGAETGFGEILALTERMRDDGVDITTDSILMPCTLTLYSAGMNPSERVYSSSVLLGFVLYNNQTMKKLSSCRFPTPHILYSIRD